MSQEKGVEQLWKSFVLILLILSSLPSVLFFYVLVNANVTKIQIHMVLFVLGWSYILWIYGCCIVPICFEELKKNRIKTKSIIGE